MTVMTPSTTLQRLCTPRWATPRRPERPTFGPELAAVGDALVADAGGFQSFMPWQRMVADVGGEYDPATGLPYYREVIVTVPRQSGKTTLYLTWQINRCTSPRWAQPQRSVFTAQSGKDARDKWLDELFPAIRKSPKIRRLVAPRGSQLAISEGMGNESIRWRTGALIRLLSTSSSSGHSKTLHQAVLDEIWHDVDPRREQGLRPAMVTVGDAQVLVCSTAGTAASLVYNRKVQQGRAAVERDSGRGVAYFEYSAPDDWDPLDEESYFGFMPALCPDPPCRCGNGRWRHTITLDVVRDERESLEPIEFARAYGNRPAIFTDHGVLPGWGNMFVDAAPPPPAAIGVSTSMDAEFGSIASADLWDDGRVNLSAVDRRPGTAWIVAEAERIQGEHGCAVAIDEKCPDGTLIGALEDAGVAITVMRLPDLVAACSELTNRVREGTVTHQRTTELDEAVSVADWREVGDGRRVFGRRRSSGPVDMLEAATAAMWAALNPGMPAIY